MGRPRGSYKPRKSRKYSPKMLNLFIEQLSKYGIVTVAAEKAGNLDRRLLYEKKEEDPEFAKRWDNAIEKSIDLLEDEARRRAYDGYDKPVFQKGVKVGVIREYSDTLLIFLMKANRPEKYREYIYSKHESTIRGNITIEVVQFGATATNEVAHDTKNQITTQRLETPALPGPAMDVS